jgi:hypothetical protein
VANQAVSQVPSLVADRAVVPVAASPAVARGKAAPRVSQAAPEASLAPVVLKLVDAVEHPGRAVLLVRM